MLELTNSQLRIEVLDPQADRTRLGVRYCAGGYVFQIHDHRHGPLLSGPTFPNSFNWFDGQGIPDAFNLSPLNSNHRFGEALIIGIGVCDLPNKQVRQFSDWQLQQHPDLLQFSTHQQYESYSLHLQRSLHLQERTLRSYTKIKNAGQAFIPMRWFPHPFYPQLTDSDDLIRINAPLRWQDTDSYTKGKHEFVRRRNWPWTEGHYLPLDHDAVAPLVLLQRHPQLGLVSASTSYVPGFFPIWGNALTFSWEPFFERLIAPNQELSWWIDYNF